MAKLKTYIPDDQKLNIIHRIIHGDSLEIISKDFNISPNCVFMVINDPLFAAKSLESFKILSKSFSIMALHNIARIAFDPTSSPATRLKASKALADIALNIDDSHHDEKEPSTMTQNELAARLQALQKEAVNRAKPVKGVAIDHAPDIDFDLMME
jgi:hypothetical protein